MFLQVFPQPLYYNRLTGTFLEVNDGDNTVVDDYPHPVTPPYGATDEERERMLEWAKDERLPLFLRSVSSFHIVTSSDFIPVSFKFVSHTSATVIDLF